MMPCETKHRMKLMKTFPMFLPSLACAMLAVVLLNGCASSGGPKFSLSGDARVQPAEGQALVFIYRTPNFVDSANNWIVGINTQSFVTVPNGTYYFLPVEPGTHRFTSRFENSPLNFGLATLFNKDREVLKLDAQAGQTYYLKLFAGQLTEMPPEKAKDGLSKCRKIPVVTDGTVVKAANR